MGSVRVVMLLAIVLLSTAHVYAGAINRGNTHKSDDLCRIINSNTVDNFIEKHLEAVKYDYPEAGYNSYINIDIDKDGITDKVVNSSGSQETLLMVGLSGGGKYEIDESGYSSVIRYGGKFYEIIMHRSEISTKDGLVTGNIDGIKIYWLSPNGPKCRLSLYSSVKR